MRSKSLTTTLLTVTLTALLFGPVSAGSGFEPAKSECIAPSGPGGGWDFTCRSVSKMLREMSILKSPMQVTNMSGGGGGVAFSNIVTKRGDDNNLLIAASPATTLRLSQRKYGRFSADDVRWLGAVAADFAVIAVRADSPYESLDDLIGALRKDPKAVKFSGGSPLGGQDHMKLLILAQSAGIDPLKLNYTAFDGGAEALTTMLGGFVDAFPGDSSEVIGQLEAGKIRVLAALTPKRLAAPFDKIPTAKELGYEAEWIVFRGFYVPKGISDEAYEWWAAALKSIVESPDWAKVRAQRGLGEFFMAGAKFDAYVKKQVSNFAKLSQSLGIIK